MKLIELRPDCEAYITSLRDVPVKMLEMGVLEGSKIKLLKASPLQQMLLLQLHGNRIALPQELAEKIEIEPLPDQDNLYCRKLKK